MPPELVPFHPSVLLHGGDYNPEQWLRYPGIIDKDFELFAQARLNSISVGIFSWATLEPAEGRFEFGWLDDIFERAQKQDMHVILATPSGAKPNWLAHAYPEVRRVSAEGLRDQQQGRHNHCPTSPVYREKVRVINTRLAERYGRHPSLALWHLSNEYGGYCYCDLCKDAFRSWIRKRYATLDDLNEAYWSRFWSHTYTAWEQIDCIDWTVNGLVRDWKLFMTDQLCSFIRNESEPLRRHSPGIPTTANLMYFFMHFDYWKVARELDVVSWDSYPTWHAGNPELDETEVAASAAFNHDLFRSLKGGQPFLLMETTPSQVNYYPFCPLRRPGLHRLSALQAVAHGADAVCYFQMRKGRGSTEQFHGAVIDHVGHGETRVFREVAALGETLEKLQPVLGARTQAKVALIYDWNSHWAIEAAGGPQTQRKHYVETVLSFYRPLWSQGIAVDIVHPESDLSGYALVLAPMVFLLSEPAAANFSRYVERGGTLVATYHTAVVDEHARAHLGGAPGNLCELFGIWVEEADALPASYGREVEAASNQCGLEGRYGAFDYLELIHATTATPIATYAHDFYAGQPAATVHQAGRGRAFYLAARTEPKFQEDLLGYLATELKLPRALEEKLPHGVTAQLRSNDHGTFLFLLNFTPQSHRLALPDGPWHDAEDGSDAGRALDLAGYGSRVLVRLP